MKKIGIYGGSFDPITKSHMLAACSVLKYVDETWFLPCWKSQTKIISDSHHRMNMIHLAIKQNDKVKLCDLEIKNQFEYTMDTIGLLQKIHKDKRFYFVAGMDNANKFPDKIINSIPFIIVSRKSHKSNVNWYKFDPHLYVEIDDEVCSSTQVRYDIKENGYSHLIENVVLNYILKNKLY